MAQIIPLKPKRTKRRPSKLFQINLTLQECTPPIWRRLLLPSGIRLPVVHLIFQTAMGWTNSHLHQFRQGEVYYGPMDPGEKLELLDEERYALHDLLETPGQQLVYEYDLGDLWTHDVLLENVFPMNRAKDAEPVPGWRGFPVCIAGARACPPEDCGGPPGYENLLSVVNDPADPDHEDMTRWLGLFDPEAFDLKRVNRSLRTLKA